MYEPKLPVTGVSFLALGFSSFFGIALMVLLAATLSIILFRFTRLLIKEGKLKELIKFMSILSLGLIMVMAVGKVESNNRLKQAEAKFDEYKEALDINQDKDINNIDIINKEVSEEEITGSELQPGDIMGSLYIENIGLQLPIIEDASDENLWIGAAHIAGTPYYWEKGNSFISSHNIKTYGKLFNRLKELKVGDKIVISDSNNDFNYVVYDIDVVLPDDTMCFDKIKGEYNLSLVTCTNYGKKRLIVYTERI